MKIHYNEGVGSERDETMKNQHKPMKPEKPAGSEGPATAACRLLSAGRFAGTGDVGWHTHEGHEIILVTEGRCAMSAGRDLWFEGGPGTLYVLPRGADQYHRSYEFTRDIYLVFQAPATRFDPTARTLQVPVAGLCGRLFNEICDLYLGPAAAEAGPVLDALLLALLEEINREEHHLRQTRSRHPALQRAVAFLEANLDRTLAMPELARRAAASPSHLTALFRQEFGCPPLRLHLRWRLERAARLLGGRMHGVKETAAAAGFADPNYFIRRFRQQFGQPPAAWQKAGGVVGNRGLPIGDADSAATGGRP